MGLGRTPELRIGAYAIAAVRICAVPALSRVRSADGSPRRARSTPRHARVVLVVLAWGSQSAGDDRGQVHRVREGDGTRPPTHASPNKFPSSSKVRSNARMVAGGFQARMG